MVKEDEATIRCAHTERHLGLLDHVGQETLALPAFLQLPLEAQFGDRHGELVGQALPEGDVLGREASGAGGR